MAGRTDGADRRVKDRQTDRQGLTSALLQLDAVAHVDVVDPDVASGRVIEESLEHHLDTRHGDVKAAAPGPLALSQQNALTIAQSDERPQ